MIGGHPKKIELQIVHLLSNPTVAANLSEHARASTQILYFRVAGRPGFFLAPYFGSLMFRRAEVLNNLGYWDDIRGGVEDAEFLKRVDLLYGRNKVKRLITGPMLLARLHEKSLTKSPVTGYPGFSFGARLEYQEASGVLAQILYWQ